MLVKELIEVLNKNTVLDISAMDGAKKDITCFSCKANKLPKKYFNWYVGYAAAEKTEWSYCAKDYLRKENINACLLLDIYKSKEEAKKE